jgi:outer membrane protein OmpA-like peptidoglycan-associated protein
MKHKLEKEKAEIARLEREKEELQKELEEAEARRKQPAVQSFSLNAATFKLGSSELTDESKANIRQLAEKISGYTFTKITIEGHTDSTGSAQLNKRLSKERARVVFDELAKHGINPEKMQYVGFGHTMPIDTNKTPAGRANNRRVEIFVE